MEINETTILDDRGFIKINGDEAGSFLQNIVTNDIEKITDSLTLFSSIFTPQGKYLYEFFILKFEDGYLLECEKKITSEIIKIFNYRFGIFNFCNYFCPKVFVSWININSFIFTR